jgi:hypothetical protein
MFDPLGLLIVITLTVFGFFLVGFWIGMGWPCRR